MHQEQDLTAYVAKMFLAMSVTKNTVLPMIVKIAGTMERPITVNLSEYILTMLCYLARSCACCLYRFSSEVLSYFAEDSCSLRLDC